MLKGELRKIEAKKKEREKKTQDLQKLIAQADSTATANQMAKETTSTGGGGGSHKKSEKNKTKKSVSSASRASTSSSSFSAKDLEQIDLVGAGIKFPDFKAPGITLRSQRIKLPQSVGTKKTKAIEQMLGEIAVDTNPMPTEAICSAFNDLRSDMVLLYDLKNALSSCDMEIQSMKMTYEGLCPGKSLEVPEKLKAKTSASASLGVAGGSGGGGAGEGRTRNLHDVIDVVGNGATPPMRKRKAALEQSNVLKKIKNKNF